MKMRVCIVEADTPTAAGYVYPAKVLDTIAAIKTPITGVCEIGVGYDPLTVNLADVSHQFTDLKVEHGKLYGVVTTLNTPAGKILEQLIGCGHVTYGLSGVGELVGSDSMVVSNYQLCSIDVISVTRGDNEDRRTIKREHGYSRIGLNNI
jgi:hypothetical protein